MKIEAVEVIVDIVLLIWVIAVMIAYQRGYKKLDKELADRDIREEIEGFLLVDRKMRIVLNICFVAVIILNVISIVTHMTLLSCISMAIFGTCLTWCWVKVKQWMRKIE